MEVRRIKGDAADGRAPAARPRWAPPPAGRGRQPARPLRPGDAERRTGQRARGVHRRPPRPVQVRPAGAEVPPGQRGPAGFRSSARLGADEAWFEGELTSTEEFSSPSRHAVAHRLPHLPGPRAAVLAGTAGALLGRAPLRSEWQLLLRRRDARRLLDGVERRRPRPARRGRLPDRRPDADLWPHRRRRGTGPHADAVPHDRPTRAVGLHHRARRPGAGHGPVDLRGLGGGQGPPARRRPVRITTSSRSATGHRAACSTSRPASCRSPPPAWAPPPPSARAARSRRSARCRTESWLAAALAEARSLAAGHALRGRHRARGPAARTGPVGPARRRRRPARARRHGSTHHHRPGPGRQGSRVRCRRGGRTRGHRRRGPSGPAAALCRHDPPDPAPERGARPPPPCARSWAERHPRPLRSPPWHSTWTARSL